MEVTLLSCESATLQAAQLDRETAALVNSLGWIPVVWLEPKDFPHCRLRTGLILVQEHRVVKLSGFTPAAMAPLSSDKLWFAELGSKQSNKDLVDIRGMVGTYNHATPLSVCFPGYFTLLLLYRLTTVFLTQGCFVCR